MRGDIGKQYAGTRFEFLKNNHDQAMQILVIDIENTDVPINFYYFQSFFWLRKINLNVDKFLLNLY
jgi:hypothetical protein